MMIVDVKMPKLGESLTEGTVLRWLKKPGETIKKDEVLLEISTDKVDSEIPSPIDGVIKELLFKENETVEVGTVVARIETEMEEEVSKKTGEVKEEILAVSTEISAEGKIKEPNAHDSQKWEKSDKFFSPLVKTIARQEGISQQELENIPGSGSGQRVTKNDVLNYLKKRKGMAVPAETVGRTEMGRVEIITMDNVRKKIAEHMRQSLDTSAHVYSVSECDLSKVMSILQEKREAFLQEEGFKLTVTPFFLYATVKALLDFPRVNSSLEGDKIIERKYIHLGVAVATPKGLIVPVIKNAEEKSFRGLARVLNELVQKARNNKLTYDDIQGSTFSVTNYGVFGNIIGLPIINQPNVAILGIGSIKKRPVVIEKPDGDFIAIRSMAFISMSYDHRLIDGELGGRFMQRLVEYLEKMPPEIL